MNTTRNTKRWPKQSILYRFLLDTAARLVRVNDQYAVFVVQPDGELAMRPVEVGLQDVVNAEILSGLEAGEVISLGQSSAPTGEPAQGDEEMPGPPGQIPFGRMFGG